MTAAGLPTPAPAPPLALDENELIIRGCLRQAAITTRRALLSRGARKEADLIQATKWSQR